MKPLFSYGYWGTVGALIGMGVITLYSIGVPLVLIGVALALLSLKQGTQPNLWATLLGMGSIPALYLTVMYLTTTCIPNTPGCHTYYPPGHTMMIGVFGVLAVVGVIGALVTRLQRSHQSH